MSYAGLATKSCYRNRICHLRREHSLTIRKVGSVSEKRGRPAVRSGGPGRAVQPGHRESY